MLTNIKQCFCRAVFIFLISTQFVLAADFFVHDATGQKIGEYLDFGTLDEMSGEHFVKVVTDAGHVMRLVFVENGAGDSDIFPLISLPTYYDNPDCLGTEYGFIGSGFEESGDDPWGGIVRTAPSEKHPEPRFFAMPAIGFEPSPGSMLTYYQLESEMCGEAGEFDNLHDISPYQVTADSLGLTTSTGFEMPFELRRSIDSQPADTVFCSGFEQCTDL